MEELLDRQSVLQSELQRSQQSMEESAERLSTLMTSVDKDADFVTYVAMLPFKTIPQKLSINVGLALMLKVGYDVLFPVLFPSVEGGPMPITTLSSTEMTSLVLQLAVGVYAWQYAGLWRVILNSLHKKTDDVSSRIL